MINLVTVSLPRKLPMTEDSVNLSRPDQPGITRQTGRWQSMLTWKTSVSVSYFLLVGLLALAMVLFFLGWTELALFAAVLTVVVGFAGYSSFRAFKLGEKAQTIRKPNSSQATSILAVFTTVALAWLSYLESSVFFAAVFIGATGGLIHEFAQSNGKFVLPQTDKDNNWYLGGLFGLVAGGISGIILVQGLAETVVTTRLVGEAFLAGLGLKGFADAVAAKRP